jgi:signal peptidase I
MEPTLHDKDVILVDKASSIFHAPARGDVVVFFAPLTPEEKYIKRIIGIPGDVITVNNNTVVILNGTTLNETYVDPTMRGNVSPPIVNEVIPPNKYFVMGDGRRYSSDSREWGLVPRANIIGRVAFVYGRKSGFLPDVSSVFANVHR